MLGVPTTPTPGHDTNDCWALKNKVKDLINVKEIEFDPHETPNVIISPIPKHDQGINVVDDVLKLYLLCLFKQLLSCQTLLFH